MAQKDWFESWFGSPYYRALYQERDELEAQEFAQTLLRYLQPLPGSKMLDIACGEGRLSRELARSGHDVTGIDLSGTSIALAKKSEAANLHFYVHDMRLPFYINYFDYAFNFFTSFGYFAHPRDHRMAARSFASALKPGGVLVLDYLNSIKVARELVAEQTIVRSGIEFQISKRIEDGAILKDIEFRDQEGKERRYTERVAAFELEDFARLFRKAGLQVVGTFGDYQLGAFDPAESPRLILILKK
jgi:SAM-dependent methyltransferase